MKLDLHTLTQQHNLTPRGIIHIGAYEGKDLKRYPTPDTAKILLIEANPKAVEHLQANFADKPNVIVSQTAIANHTTPVTLNLTSIESNSSILPLSGYREIYPNLKVTQQITLESRSLDTLLRELNLRPVDFNFLYLDIQGAELLALQGATQLLKYIEAIYTTVSYEDLFEGGALIDEMDAFLAQHHFVRVAEANPYHPAWGEVFYLREHLSLNNDEPQLSSNKMTPPVVEETVTKAELLQTQQELEDLQSRYEQIQKELEQSQIQQQQTQTELSQTQQQLQTSQTELSQTQQQLQTSQTELTQTQQQLQTSQTELSQTQQQLDQSRSELHETREELELTQFQLDEIQVELEQSVSQLHQTKEELAHTQEKLQQTQAELTQLQQEQNTPKSSPNHSTAHVKMLAKIIAETLPDS
ncbi:methyltransferase, FkbM family domain protein [Lyngbya aestuarii BL J]|uniref:Methyltransferase, FkbM family domain protein n=1 Tax=Lyngbya aestuarii BL J TaxID=1348334 RepID=U7QA14_9CYAN|nr:FkbM family methyltransferase [Lyngbya aestuarii]ERT04012.1 methyltransferase, FkbM family domain protein [Lyngbya aestuarii BL J]